MNTYYYCNDVVFKFDGIPDYPDEVMPVIDAFFSNLIGGVPFDEVSICTAEKYAMYLEKVIRDKDETIRRKDKLISNLNKKIGSGEKDSDDLWFLNDDK